MRQLVSLLLASVCFAGCLEAPHEDSKLVLEVSSQRLWLLQPPPRLSKHLVPSVQVAELYGA
jgi:hypothetical protein